MRYVSCAKVTVRYRMTYMERMMTDNQIAKYLEQIAKHCKAARANPTASTVHIDAIQDLAEHVVKTMKKERPDVTGAPV
jgi:phosphoribosylformylglycinamidine (FGAM) synthase-like amidotransferase family enzyme